MLLGDMTSNNSPRSGGYTVALQRSRRLLGIRSAMAETSSSRKRQLHVSVEDCSSGSESGERKICTPVRARVCHSSLVCLKGNAKPMVKRIAGKENARLFLLFPTTDAQIFLHRSPIHCTNLRRLRAAAACETNRHSRPPPKQSTRSMQFYCEIQAPTTVLIQARTQGGCDGCVRTPSVCRKGPLSSIKLWLYPWPGRRTHASLRASSASRDRAPMSTPPFWTISCE